MPNRITFHSRFCLLLYSNSGACARGRAGERAKANNVFHPRRFFFPCASDEIGMEERDSPPVKQEAFLIIFPGARLLLASGVARRL